MAWAACLLNIHKNNLLSGVSSWSSLQKVQIGLEFGKSWDNLSQNGSNWWTSLNMRDLIWIERPLDRAKLKDFDQSLLGHFLGSCRPSASSCVTNVSKMESHHCLRDTCTRFRGVSLITFLIKSKNSITVVWRLDRFGYTFVLQKVVQV